MTTTLTEADGVLFYKAIILRQQAQAFEQTRVIAALQDRVATLERAALDAARTALAHEALAQLDAPAGATFNWQTFGWTEGVGTNEVPRQS